jgi:CheY-like chemotaxis protein
MKRILIVEDNPRNLELAAVILELEYEILEAENGKLGVAMARDKRPDLILMDLSMPELDGFGALKELRADSALARIPVVAFTAHAHQADRDAAQQAGFDAYVTKPVDADELLKTVERLLGGGA